MLSHGVVSAALFLCVGVIYDRLHTREIARYGGLVHRMPAYAFVFMIFTMAAVGLPGTSGFVGEFLVLVGVYQANTWTAVLITTGIILAPAYMLWLYRRLIFGKLEREDLKKMMDLSGRESLVFLPLIIVVLWMGIYPQSFLDIIHGSVANLIDNYQAAVGVAPATALAP
jgi:NADH-quinone oxidoreductase subunit M